MTDKPLTERQYEELRSYEHGKPSWRGHHPNRGLVGRGLLVATPETGRGFFRITGRGKELLVEFRRRHGIPEMIAR